MHKVEKQSQIAHIAAVFTVALLTVFSLFLSLPDKYSAGTTLQITSETAENNHTPAGRYDVINNIFRSTVPSVQSSRNEISSNPPAQRLNEALFTRSYIEIINVFRSDTFQTENSVFQICLKNSIPARAGPLKI
ncbi:MAG: hypothetical protein IKA22_08965 [Lentisphaeria bacterium]|nr:hypothetical protein [Lentisphaeria bacterium]